MDNIEIYGISHTERFRVEIWNGFDKAWDEWDERDYPTAEDAIKIALSAKEQWPDDRFRVIGVKDYRKLTVLPNKFSPEKL